MLRLAVITSYFPIREQPHRGHSAYQTLRKMSSWMTVQAFCPFARYPSRFRPRNFSYAEPDSAYSPTDVNATYISYPALPVLSRPFNGSVAARYVLPHLERFQPDLILSYYIYPDGYAAILAGQRLGIPVILGAIGSDINRIPDRLSARLTRTALREASFVLTVSEHLRAGAIQLGAAPGRTRAVRNGCDESIFHLSSREGARTQLGLNPESEVVAFVGWLAPTKGLWELFDAVIRLLPSHPQLQLCCIGEGDLKSELEARAVAAGIEKHVRLLGSRSSTEVACWLTAASIFCLPSYAEGCPNSVIEALACGRPVVATRVGGIPELVDDAAGILIPPRDSEALARALDQALAAKWDERGISQRFRRGWEQAAKETYQICLECIGRGPLA